MYRILILALLSLLLIACGGGSGDGNSSSSSSSGGADSGSSSSSSSSSGSSGGSSSSSGSSSGGSSVTTLEGTWIKACGIADPNDPDSHSDIVTTTFSGNQLDSNIENYQDAACTVPLPVAPNPTSSGTFTVGDTLTTTGGLQATEIDSHIDTFNGAPFVIDEFTIFYIDGNSLFLGDDSGALDALSDATRPDTLNFNREFIRQ